MTLEILIGDDIFRRPEYEEIIQKNYILPVQKKTGQQFNTTYRGTLKDMIAAAQEKKYDLIITDLDYDERDSEKRGKEGLYVIEVLHAAGCGAPIVLCTGSDSFTLEQALPQQQPTTLITGTREKIKYEVLVDFLVKKYS